MLSRKFAFLLENRYGKLSWLENNLPLVKYEIIALISYFAIRPIFLRGALQAECHVLCVEIVNIESRQ
jgi:hypothetical protein